MTEITEISEALKLLNVVVERGGELSIETSKGRWEAMTRPGQYVTDIICWRSEKLPRAEQPIGGFQENDDAVFAAFAHVLVPAMVKGAEAVLKLKKDLDGHAWCPPDKQAKDRERGAAECCDHVIVILARDYRPALVELGWWK